MLRPYLMLRLTCLLLCQQQAGQGRGFLRKRAWCFDPPTFDEGVAQTEIHHEMERLRRKIADLHQECKALPIGSKHGTGILLAMREWEPALFSGLRRNKRS